MSRATPALAPQSNNQANERGPQAVHHHEPHNVVALFAQRHANSDLASPLRNDIREHSEESHPSKQQGERCKASQQCGIEALIDRCLASNWSIVSTSETGRS